MCVCVCVSYHTTKMRERTVVRITTENRTSTITRPKLPSSSGAGSEQEEGGAKQAGGGRQSKREGRKQNRQGGGQIMCLNILFFPPPSDHTSHVLVDNIISSINLQVRCFWGRSLTKKVSHGCW